MPITPKTQASHTVTPKTLEGSHNLGEIKPCVRFRGFGFGLNIKVSGSCTVEPETILKSADLGGRVGWLPKAERVKTLFLSPLQPQNAGGGGGGGGGGGVGGVSRLRFPPGPHLRSSRFSRHPRLRPGPQAPGARHSQRLTFCKP